MTLTTHENLRKELENKIVKFKFLKKNGIEEREAYGTLCNKYIPQTKQSSKTRANSFFDIELQDWRSWSKGASFYIISTLNVPTNGNQ